MVSLPAFPGLVALGPRWGRALLAVARRLGVSADELAATIDLESGGRARVPSPGGTRGGLIQWSDRSARASGAPSLAALLAEDAIGQLRYVEGYLRPYARRCVRPGDVRLAVFAPAGLGLEDGDPLPLALDTVRQNRALDRDGDGVIAAGEPRAQLLAHLVGRPRWTFAEVGEDDTAPVVLALGLGALLAWRAAA